MSNSSSIWPFWDALSPQPIDPWNQAAAGWWRQPIDSSAGATPQPNDAWDRTTPAWLRSAVSPTPSGGILGAFPWSNDAQDQTASTGRQSDTSPDTGRGILGQLDRWNVPTSQGAPWLESAMPFASISGSPDWRVPPNPSPWGNPGATVGMTPSRGDDWLSLVRKALEPLTSYPQTYSQMNREAREQAALGLEQLKQAYQPGVHDPGGFVKGLANLGFGTIEYANSPIHAALRTIAGRPFEETIGIPKEYTEFALSLGMPGLGRRPAIPGAAAPKIPHDFQLKSDPWSKAFESGPQTRALEDMLPPITRHLTDVEKIQWFRTQEALDALRRLDPKNPEVLAFEASPLYPNSGQAELFNQEIRNLKKRLKEEPSSFSQEVREMIAALDDHHNFGRKWANKFRSRGIEPDEYNMYLDAGRHRLLGYGKDGFDKQWERYIKENREPTIDDLFRQLASMMEQRPWWRAPRPPDSGM
jgi:hypothetical protein